MKEIVCDNCGSNRFTPYEEGIRCNHCGTLYENYIQEAVAGKAVPDYYIESATQEKDKHSPFFGLAVILYFVTGILEISILSTQSPVLRLAAMLCIAVSGLFYFIDYRMKGSGVSLFLVFGAILVFLITVLPFIG